ncbi:coxsackievirus and adenovirus receptor homolog%2C partial [Scomber scombrus]|uniref:Coxsackievirus and adenovirus receptor homolog, partial n=1 Tax=Scomber scombrus TaxID=13677 RepID=A0AAV1Q3Q8_SCOSC
MDRLTVGLVAMMALGAKGLEINTTNNNAIVEKAVGESVKLECKFTTDPGDTGPLEIEWTVKSTPGSTLCQVKKIPGIRSIKALLRVLRKPSKPECHSTEGAGEVGRTKVLHCGSGEGAPPIRYHWSRRPPWKLLSDSAVTDETAGTLTIKDASESDSGTYQCTAVNRVGTEVCFLELYMAHPPSVGTIVGAVLGGLAAIGTIASTVNFMMKDKKKKKKEQKKKKQLQEQEQEPVKVKCPMCGVRYASLSRHLRETHGVEDVRLRRLLVSRRNLRYSGKLRCPVKGCNSDRDTSSPL